MIKIQDISTGTIIQEKYFPNNSILFGPRELDTIAIFTLDQKLIAFGKYDEFQNSNNITYSSVTDVLSDLLLNYVSAATSGGATEATLLEVLDAAQNIQIDAESVNLNTDQLEALITSTNTKIDALNLAASDINTKLGYTERTPQYYNTDADGASGTIALGAYKVNFANTGYSDALVLGKVLPKRTTLAFETNWKDTLSAISYNAQSSTLIITVIR